MKKLLLVLSAIMSIAIPVQASEGASGGSLLAAAIAYGVFLCFNRAIGSNSGKKAVSLGQALKQTAQAFKAAVCPDTSSALAIATAVSYGLGNKQLGKVALGATALHMALNSSLPPRLNNARKELWKGIINAKNALVTAPVKKRATFDDYDGLYDDDLYDNVA